MFGSLSDTPDEEEIERQLLESFARRHYTRSSRPRGAAAPSHSDSEAGPESPERLELRQRYFVALKETEGLAEDLERLKVERERASEQARADAEEAELRIADLKREAWEFRRDILAASAEASPMASLTFSMSLTGEGALSMTGATAPMPLARAEAVREYFDRKLQNRATQADKLRLKNASLQAQIQRLEKEVTSRQDETAEGFSPIDFQQLKIENQQFQERIDARNQELLRLKVQAATTGQALNRSRKRLESQVADNVRLKARIAQQRAALAQLASESSVVSDDRDRAQRINQKLRAQQEEYKVPEVLEYITLKAELHEVQKHVGEWERKIEIAQMAARKQRSQLQSAASSTSVSGSGSGGGVLPALSHLSGHNT